MFEKGRFVTDCRAAFAQEPSHKAVREVLARAVSDPTAVLKGPQRAEIQKIFHSDALTILNVVWAPGMMVMPHNHRMWAVIGIYTGREDNVFWRRLKGTPNEIDAVGAKALREMDAEPLGTDIIHSVINPINKLTGAIHIYGGDFFAAERSEWDSMTLLEHRSDGERVRRVFEEANAVTKRANTFMRADVWPLSDTLEHLGRAARTSASGPKRTSRPRQGMSAFGGKADIAISVRHHDKQ